MNALYEYVKNNYTENEPIFLTDISLTVSSGNIRQMFKTLCDSGKLCRFDSGIYYIPGKSRLKGVCRMDADTVVRYKYIERKGEISGYYSGFTFANQLGVTTQVPFVPEIVSNNASAAVRRISLGGRQFVLRKAQTQINNDNYKVLQLLDFLKDARQYTDSEDSAFIIRDYIVTMGLKKTEVERYVKPYPDRIFRYMYELGVYNVIT